jgi:hypothetical protein
MDQATLLRLAKRELQLSCPGLAETLGVSPRTMAKWTLGPDSGDRRAMPLIARRFLVHLLDAAKRRHLESGDRTAAERIDALSAQADPARMRESLLAFDALQRTADTLVPMTVRRRPPHFRTWASKAAWEEKEALADTRRARAQSARSR